MGNQRKRGLLLGLALPLLSTPASYGQGLLELLDQVANGGPTMVSHGSAQAGAATETTATEAMAVTTPLAQIPSLPTPSTPPEDPAATASPAQQPVNGHRAEPRQAHNPWSPPPPLAALVRLESHVSCAPLQREVLAILGSERSAWSVTVADPVGRLMADVNGQVPRIPASNQKLISTALAMDRLGVNHRLRTSLWRLPDGTLRLEGQGDPGFGPQQVTRMAAALSGQGVNTGTVSMEFEEMGPKTWWPADWHTADRNWDYGAPVTRLAVSANSSGDYAVYDPPQRLARIWSQVLSQQGYDFQWVEVPADSPNPQGSQLIHEELSQPLQSLITRANTESHNNTAEVLLRVGSGSWNLSQASRITLQWLKDKDLPVDGVTIADGSGLSRSNRSTTRFYTSLLLTMQHHANGSNWYGTMAVANRTGTLERFSSSQSLTGRFVGKTGTIRGVKALSGRMDTPHGHRFFSLLANGSVEPRSRMVDILEAVLKHSSCPRVF